MKILRRLVAAPIAAVVLVVLAPFLAVYAVSTWALEVLDDWIHPHPGGRP